MRRFLAVSLSALLSLLPACAKAHIRYPAPPVPTYVQQQVAGPLALNERICVVGDSLTGRGSVSGGWMEIWDQFNQSCHPEYNFQLFNAGYAYLSSTVLDYPGYGDFLWQTQVVAHQPTIVVFWIGIDDALFNGGHPDMAQYGVNLQHMIDAARQIPSVRQIVLVTPMCYGEKRNFTNPEDGALYQLIAVINQTSINNNVPVIDMRSMIVSADLAYNGADLPYGVLTGDGIHPFCSTSWTPPDRVNFISPTCEQLIAFTFFKAFGE